MANPTSSIESHPQRQRIIEAIAAGRPYREICAWSNPPVTTGALSRFKSRAIAVTDQAVIAAKAMIANNDSGLTTVNSEAVTRASLAVAVDPFVGELLRKSTRRERWISDAEGKADGMDHRALAAYDRNGTADLELHARLTGRLDSGNTTTNNTLLVMMPAAIPHQSPVIDIEPGE